MGARLSAPGRVYLLALPTLLVLLLVDPSLSWVLTDDGSFGGWNLINHMFFFLSGFLLASSAGMQASIRRLRRVSLAIGLLLFPVAIALLAVFGEPPFGTPLNRILNTFSCGICWCGV